MNRLQLWAQSDLQQQNVQTLATTITTTYKLLEYKEGEKGGPRNGEYAQGEDRKWKNNKKDIEKVSSYGKTGKDKAK